ncbi:MAG: hypothetical protein KDD19_05760, partial [Phaeodactylibacter sp.]|nr:hypothetical protein [Phaeodactylibacter sp.]
MPENNPYPESDDIRLNSGREDIQRMLGNPPGWSLRWGITAVLVAVVLFIGLAWLVKFPDVITARVVIMTENPPVRIFARSSGKISLLLAGDKQAVEAGEIIAVLENPARLEDIRQLESLLPQLENVTDPETLVQLQLPNGLQLGEMQNAYASYQQAFQDFQFFERQRGVFAQAASLQKQAEYLAGLNTSLEKQERTLIREVEIAQRSFDRNKGLLQSGAISQLELEQSETNYLQYRRQLENLQSQALNNKLQIERLQSQILNLHQERAEESMENWLATRELLSRLVSELEIWKQAYLITSPI